MYVGHLDHTLLTVYSLMVHVTWKSPGPMCRWVGRILHPNSCTSVSSWSKVPLLSIWSVAVPLCRPLLPCPMVLFHGMVCDGWLVSYTALPYHGGSALCTSCERVHFLCSLILRPSFLLVFPLSMSIGNYTELCRVRYQLYQLNESLQHETPNWRSSAGHAHQRSDGNVLFFCSFVCLSVVWNAYLSGTGVPGPAVLETRNCHTI